MKHLPTFAELLNRSDADLMEGYSEATEMMFLLASCSARDAEIEARRDLEFDAYLEQCNFIDAILELRLLVTV